MQSIDSMTLEQILNVNKTPILIAIDGRCAAGKTTLAENLRKVINCNVVHMDHFFLQAHQRTKQRLQEPGGNIDYERFLKEVLLPLSQGEEVIYRSYDCKKAKLLDYIEMKPTQITIIEGSYSCHPTLWHYYDLRIFLDVLPEEQLRRIQNRNGTQAATIFCNRWIPLEEQYFSYYQIQERCDFIYQV